MLYYPYNEEEDVPHLYRWGGSSHNRRRAYISRLVETLIGGFCLRQNLNNGVIIPQGE